MTGWVKGKEVPVGERTGEGEQTASFFPFTRLNANEGYKRNTSISCYRYLGWNFVRGNKNERRAVRSLRKTVPVTENAVNVFLALALMCIP